MGYTDYKDCETLMFVIKQNDLVEIVDRIMRLTDKRNDDTSLKVKEIFAEFDKGEENAKGGKVFYR